MLPIDLVVVGYHSFLLTHNVGVPDIALHIFRTGDDRIVSINWLVPGGVRGRGLSHSLSLAGSLSPDGCGDNSNFARFVVTRGSLVIFIDDFGNIIEDFRNVIDDFGNIIDDFGNIMDDFDNIIGSRIWDIGYLGG
ncbi:hypothetical protein K440DRAFT_642212 [Wilcoxina mikolae CBS 423.85]|nr:hypothetical protein K440DRAFT_642212 [Wilcoxina mikolae CBS 423.85]